MLAGLRALSLVKDLRALLARALLNNGALLVGFTQRAAGAVGRLLQDKLEERVSAEDFGAVGDGVTNDTAALHKFYSYCISTSTTGYIGPGTYMVDLGALAFDTGHVTTKFPVVETAGHMAVVFVNSADTDAPFLSFTNGTATSGVGKFWEGGYHGGVSFRRTTGTSTKTAQHGLLLRGFFNTSFGYMRADAIGGNTIHIQRQLFGGSNPDPYHVASCVFDGVEANSCGGNAFYNDNYVGLSGCTILRIRAVNNSGGAFFGFGTSNIINTMSVGSCAGWALGNPTDVTGGAANRFSLGFAELDDVQYGIDLRRLSGFDIAAIRFNHRFNFSSLNPSEGYWPRVAVSMASSSGISQGYMDIIDRVEAGGAKANMGLLLDFTGSGGNIVDVVIRRQILDNAGFGFTAVDYYTSFNANARLIYTDTQGIPVLDTLKKLNSLARAPTTYAIPNSGYATAGATVQYSTELTDPAGCYNPATWAYTVRTPGTYRVRATVALALAVGERLRFGVALNGSIVAARFSYATTTNAQVYEIMHEVVCAVGDVITMNADQNSAGAVNLTTVGGPNDNLFSVTML